MDRHKRMDAAMSSRPKGKTGPKKAEGGLDIQCHTCKGSPKIDVSSVRAHFLNMTLHKPGDFDTKLQCYFCPKVLKMSGFRDHIPGPCEGSPFSPKNNMDPPKQRFTIHFPPPSGAIPKTTNATKTARNLPNIGTASKPSDATGDEPHHQEDAEMKGAVGGLDFGYAFPMQNEDEPRNPRRQRQVLVLPRLPYRLQGDEESIPSSQIHDSGMQDLRRIQPEQRFSDVTGQEEERQKVNPFEEDNLENEFVDEMERSAPRQAPPRLQLWLEQAHREAPYQGLPSASVTDSRQQPFRGHTRPLRGVESREQKLKREDELELARHTDRSRETTQRDHRLREQPQYGVDRKGQFLQPHQVTPSTSHPGPLLPFCYEDVPRDDFERTMFFEELFIRSCTDLGQLIQWAKALEVPEERTLGNMSVRALQNSVIDIKNDAFLKDREFNNNLKKQDAPLLNTCLHVVPCSACGSKPADKLLDPTEKVVCLDCLDAVQWKKCPKTGLDFKHVIAVTPYAFTPCKPVIFSTEHVSGENHSGQSATGTLKRSPLSQAAPRDVFIAPKKLDPEAFAEELAILQGKSLPKRKAIEQMQKILTAINEAEDGETPHRAFMESCVERHFMKKNNRLCTLAHIYNPTGEARCYFCHFTPADVESYSCEHLLCIRCSKLRPGRCPACGEVLRLLVPCDATDD